jgi:glycosyltransferase involved in cell wall biosynthesis
MAVVDIIIPTYKRLHRLRATYDQLWHEKVSVGANLIFVCHESDSESIAAVRAYGLEPVIDTQSPSGVNATNAGFRASTSEWVVIGQDDFTWPRGWLQKALAHTKDAKIIGFYDGYEPHIDMQHSVGWLVKRDVLPDYFFFPGYHKNYSDNEFNDMAKSMGVWKFAEDVYVQHEHPGFTGAELDETYTHLEKHHAEDYNLYLSRQHLWQ